MIAIADRLRLGVQSYHNPQDTLQPQNTNREHSPPKVIQIPHRRVPQKGEGNEHLALINVDASGLSLRDHQPARQCCLQEGKWYRAVFIPVLQVTETQASFLRPINDSQSFGNRHQFKTPSPINKKSKEPLKSSNEIGPIILIFDMKGFPYFYGLRPSEECEQPWGGFGRRITKVPSYKA